MKHLRIVALILSADLMAASEEPAVPVGVTAAVEAWLRAPEGKDKAQLDKACALLKGDVKLAAAAVRGLKPLTQAKPGTSHGLKFESGGRAWEYSIHLPEGYDGKRRFPVLVLPDHGAVDAESGIGFWRGKAGAEGLILFRPVIVKLKEDANVFPRQQFLAVDQDVAAVMRDALAHLRLNYAVDDDRLVMTGLSQSGYYTWYYAASFPDDFAGIVPESSGGPAVRAAVKPLAGNLTALMIRILHTEDDRICPYSDATAMKQAIEDAGGKAELITYTDKDYPDGRPWENRHPGPHNLRLKNVLDWIPGVKRTPVAGEITRVLRYSQQGREGSWRVAPPAEVTAPFTVRLSEKDGVLAVSGAERAEYLASPEDAASGREYTVGGRKIKAKPDVRLLLEDFKTLGDRGRLAGGAVEVRP